MNRIDSYRCGSQAHRILRHCVHLSLVVALPAEARPINRYFDLKPDNRQERFPLYRKGETALVISGVGKENAYSATRWLSHMTGQDPDGVWLNVGIAGHPQRALGEAVLVSGITDLLSGESWRLNPPAEAAFDCEPLITLQRPGSGYQRQALHDMEASGFCSAAHQFTSPEKIQAIKIVSDNSDNSTHNINGKIVSHLIEQQLGKISQLIEHLA